MRESFAKVDAMLSKLEFEPEADAEKKKKSGNVRNHRRTCKAATLAARLRAEACRIKIWPTRKSLCTKNSSTP